MTDLMVMIGKATVMRLARWLCVGAVVVSVAQRMTALPTQLNSRIEELLPHRWRQSD